MLDGGREVCLLELEVRLLDTSRNEQDHFNPVHLMKLRAGWIYKMYEVPGTLSRINPK